MKKIKVHQFVVYASHFTKESMIYEVAKWANSVFNKDHEGNFCDFMASKKRYSVYVNRFLVRGEAWLVQTWLIDMIYDISCLHSTGSKIITPNETLRLIDLYNDYQNEKDKFYLRKDIFLYVFGFFGEQKKFQNPFGYIDTFVREKYILDVISKKTHPLNKYGLDIQKEFYEETGYSTEDYATLLFLLWCYFTRCKVSSTLTKEIIEINDPLFRIENIRNIVQRYSTTIDELKSSQFKRQWLYSKPFVKIENEYIASNPFLLLSLFSNCLYWVIRNVYLEKKSQQFINAFGAYFEIYVEEVLGNCLSQDQYQKIQESKKEKRADWILEMGKFTIIIEQKSAISALEAKQNHPDLELMKKYMKNNWGEAIKQLHSTQVSKGLKECIKIILVYEDYYKSECIDEIFLLEDLPENDGTYWLVSINEFEMLLNTYRNDPALGLKIIEEKLLAESNKVNEGRELIGFLNKNGINKNNYIKEFNIDSDYKKMMERIFVK